MKSLTRRPRRGVLILIVLSILVMFALLGLTFVIIAGQAKRTATTAGRSEQQYDPPDRLTEEAALAIFRGSNNPGSPTWLHSLLEDMYGNDTVAGTSAPGASNKKVCGGQLVNISATVWDGTKYVPLAGADRRVGCVLTMVNGPAANRSTHIVGYDATQSPPVFQIVAFDDVSSDAVVGYAQNSPLTYIVNGAAFTGTGVGYNVATGRLDTKIDLATQKILTDPTLPGVALALLLRPFVTGAEYGAAATASGGNILANPDYTAADHQHPFLAVEVPQSDGSVKTPVPSFHRPELVNYWFNQLITGTLVSWGSITDPNDRMNAVLRPYGADCVRGNADDPLPLAEADKIADLKRRILLRPLAEDHPAFARSTNPGFNPTWGGAFVDVNSDGICDYAWDVDTDGDGIPDAIWVDFGFPVRALPDGRLVKPLVAAKIVDLDGRLNVNAHGNYAQTVQGYCDPVNVADPYYTLPWSGWYTFVFSQGMTSAYLPRGFGYGPAEINLRPLFASLGDYDSLLRNRYKPLPASGSTQPVPGSDNPADDPLHINKWCDYGRWDWNNTTKAWYWTGGNYWSLLTGGADLCGAFGSPPNRLGDGAIALDAGGRALYLRMGRSDPTGGSPVEPGGNDERLNDPYKLNLSKPTTVNSPFTPAELEAVLRNQPYEADASRLPHRLLASGLAGGHQHEITTESWHVPAPTFFIPKHLLMENPAAGPNASATRPGILDDLQIKNLDRDVRTWLVSLLPGRSAQDLVAAKVYVERRRAQPARQPADAMADAQSVLRPDTLRKLLPLELGYRVKMDINRPLDGALPQVRNVTRPDGSWDAVPPATPLTFYPDPLLNVTNSIGARQLYARHLYLLMMLLVNNETPIAGITDPNLLHREWARRIAQWAINVVSFRDRSVVMPYFEYDPDPFTPAGWRVDGELTTVLTGGVEVPSPPPPAPPTPNPYVVWGCKRPQLLITETLALHARRTEDLATETPNPGEKAGKTTDLDSDGNPIDSDFDQRKRPLGSLFVELYRPANPLDAETGEVFDPGAGQWRGGIYLDQSTDERDNTIPRPSGYPFGSPVWRLIIVDGLGPDAVKDKDPDDPTDRPVIGRSVYFRNPVDGAGKELNLGPDGKRYYTTGPVAPILHDRYAVIGPPGDATVMPPGSAATPISHRTDPGKENNCQQIILDPTANPQVQLRYCQSDTGANELPGAIKPPIAVVVDQPHRLNVSEPDDAYASRDPEGRWNGHEYLPAYDTPFDTDPRLMTDGMTPRFKVVHLQRLANPFVPFDPVTNPYRTIDSMPVDLFAYNGWEDPEIDEPGVTKAPEGLDVVLHSRERGDALVGASGFLASNIWASEPLARPGAANASPLHENLSCVGTQRPSLALQATPGLLNKPFCVNASKVAEAPRSDPPEYVGDVPPDVAPFRWLTWNSRPFVSELELPLVPYASQSMLLKAVGAGVPGSGYVLGPEANPAFPHLWDFFNSRAPATPQPEFYRLLDLVGVPSAFVGTEIQGKPDVFATSAGHTFYPPFNRIPNYREPGRLNPNTCTSEAVWTGLMNYYPGLTEMSPFVRSRKGYDDADTNHPTRFSNPIRSYAGQMLTTVLPQDLSTAEVNATLLRAHPTAAGVPLFGLTLGEPCDTSGNPFFRYQGLQRLGNLVTTRSNVFAVWITVGYFEVQPAVRPDLTADQFRAIYPDGYMLGQEAGADRGDIKRHRAFYIFDRSIPMGFQRGMDLNVQKGILLKRYIE